MFAAAVSILTWLTISLASASVGAAAWILARIRISFRSHPLTETPPFRLPSIEIVPPVAARVCSLISHGRALSLFQLSRHASESSLSFCANAATPTTHIIIKANTARLSNLVMSFLLNGLFRLLTCLAQYPRAVGFDASWYGPGGW